MCGGSGDSKSSFFHAASTQSRGTKWESRADLKPPSYPQQVHSPKARIGVFHRDLLRMNSHHTECAIQWTRCRRAPVPKKMTAADVSKVADPRQIRQQMKDYCLDEAVKIPSEALLREIGCTGLTELFEL
jgi:hypothetical protein